MKIKKETDDLPLSIQPLFLKLHKLNWLGFTILLNPKELVSFIVIEGNFTMLKGAEAQFCWVDAHVRTLGNETS